MQVVGIDFGTTNVRISTWDSDPQVIEPQDTDSPDPDSPGIDSLDTDSPDTDSPGPDSIRLPQSCLIGRGDPEHQEMMPAVVALQRQPDGSVSIAVGEDAVALDGQDNALVIPNIKRWALSDDAYVQWQLNVKNKDWPTWWNPETKCVEVWGEQFPIKTLISAILKEAIDRADLPPEFEWRAGCPVHSGLDYRAMLSDVITEFAGKGSLNWVADEPVLFLTLLWRMGSLKAGSYLVYDLGGGSFDCAVVEVLENSEMIVYGADGHPLLGGADIDQDLAERQPADAAQDASERYADVIKKGRYIERSLMSLRDAYTSAKVVWGRSSRDDYPFGETVSENDNTGEVRFVWQLSYADMAQDLDALILFGGPTSNPVFSENLSRWFGDKVKRTSDFVNVANSEFTALSMGACYFSLQEDLTENYSHMVPSRLPINVTLENTVTGEKVEYLPHQHFGEMERGEFKGPHNFFGDYKSPELKQAQDAPAEYMLTVTRQDGLVMQDSNGRNLQLQFSGHLEPRKLLQDPGDSHPATSLRLIITRLGYLWVEMRSEGAGLPWRKTFLFPDVERSPDDLPPSPPWQTNVQREAWRRIQERTREQDAKRRLRLTEALNRPAQLDVN